MAFQEINIGSAANDGTGDTLRDAFDKTNDNFIEPRFGVYNYDNTIAPYAITANTWNLITNDGLGSNTYLGGQLTGVDIYNTSTNQFDYTDLSVYDAVDIRIDCDVTTTSNNQEVRIRLLLSAGTLDIGLTFIDNVYKTASTYAVVGCIQNHIFTDAVRLQPAQLEIWSDSSATIDVNGWALKVDKRINEL